MSKGPAVEILLSARYSDGNATCTVHDPAKLPALTEKLEDGQRRGIVLMWSLVELDAVTS